jgi:ABC-type Fe3+ transport system substrate-binding protein
VPIAEVRHEKASSAAFSRIASTIARYPDKFICFDDPKVLSDFLAQGDVGLVLGGTGCFMPLIPTASASLKAIIPSEGAFMWMECAAVIHTTNDATDASRFIDHLLADDIQKILINRHAYRAFPATAKMLRETVASGAYNRFNLNDIYDTNGWNKNVRLHPRYLPDDWRAWEQSWEEITKSVRIV